MSSPDSIGGDQKGQIVKQNAFPIDLAPKIALVKPTDGKGATVQTHQFRNLTQQPMRVVVPGGTVQGAGTAQIIQTHMMQPAMLKQVDALGRTQITALPSRTMPQTSITVSRPLTPNTFMPKGVSTVTNITGPRGAIRTQTPPISTVTNISSGFVRGAPPRTPSPAGTVIPSGTTWMAGSQPVQLIRASIGHSPRARIVSQGIPATTPSSGSGIATISTNIISSQAVSQSQPQQATIQAVSSGTTVTAGNISGQPQTFVATLATVLPPRQQTATLVYSNVNNSQQFGNATTGQRLVTAPITGQRQMRPIQISNRLPTTGLGVRVSTGNISIRGPNIPVLAPSSVLTSLPAGASTTVTASNLATVTGLPAARIIQVQQQQSGGTAQVLSAGRISGNLMTLQPLVMNASAASGNTVRGTATTAKPSLTITHVNKVATPTSNSQGNVQLTTNLPQGATITATSTVGVGHQSQQHTPTSAPIGIVMGTNSSQPGSGQHQQIAQIVNLNQTGVNVGHGHQIQIIGSQNIQQGSSTVVPLTITSRAANTSLTGTTITTLPASVATNLSHIVRGNVNIVTSIASGAVASSAAGGLPVAKVLPQQQQQEQHQIKKVMTEGVLKNTTDTMYFKQKPSETIKTPTSSFITNITGAISNAESSIEYQQMQQQHAEQDQHQKQSINNDPIVSVSGISTGQNVFIHSRSPSSTTLSSGTNVVNIANSQGGSIITAPSGTYYMSTVSPTTGTATSGPIVVSSAILQPVTANSTSITTTTCNTSLSASYVPQAGSFAVVPASNRTSTNATIVSTPTIQSAQPIPVRFNPQLIVDGGNQSVQGGAIISIQQQQNQHQTMQGQPKPQQQQPIMVPLPSAKVVVSTARTPAVISSTMRKSSDNFVTTSVVAGKSGVQNLNAALMSIENETITLHQQIPRPSTPISRPGSSDGSTTVSATSSPGIDQQEQEELNALSALHRSNRNIGDGAQFKNVDIFNHSQKINAQLQQLQTNTDSHYGQITQSAHMLAYQQPHHHLQHENSAQMNLTNNVNDDLTPRKRARKQQLVDNSATPTKRYQVSTAMGQQSGDQQFNISAGNLGLASDVSMNTNTSMNKSSNICPLKGNKDSNKPIDFYIKRPRTHSLLDSYKQSWKATNNHFQRYSDVKPREERRPTVVDLANQAHVLQKVNGWKIYHLTSQMEDLTELESQVYDKLASMLQCMEAHNQNSDVDRVNDLIKGNMQRSKIVSDSINEARTQILKVFDHKSHVSDIIHRCASKRNFKKRDKS